VAPMMKYDRAATSHATMNKLTSIPVRTMLNVFIEDPNSGHD